MFVPEQSVQEMQRTTSGGISDLLKKKSVRMSAIDVAIMNFR